MGFYCQVKSGLSRTLNTHIFKYLGLSDGECLVTNGQRGEKRWLGEK